MKKYLKLKIGWGLALKTFDRTLVIEKQTFYLGPYNSCLNLTLNIFTQNSYHFVQKTLMFLKQIEYVVCPFKSIIAQGEQIQFINNFDSYKNDTPVAYIRLHKIC